MSVVADFEKFSAYAFYAGESNHIFPPNCHPHRDQSAPPLSPPSDSENEAKSASDAETEPELDNDQEIIELAQRQPSKFQEVLRLEVCLFIIIFHLSL